MIDVDSQALLAHVLAMHDIEQKDVYDVSLVGSRVMGYATEDSDYDVIIWVDHPRGIARLSTFNGQRLVASLNNCDYIDHPILGFTLPRYSLITNDLVNYDEDQVQQWKALQLARKQ